MPVGRSTPTPGEPDPTEAPADRFAATLASARLGDEQAFAEIWRLFNPPLVRFLASLAGRGDAEDLASATWVEVVRSLDSFSGTDAGFRSWLFTIARHRMLDLRRAQARRPRADVEVPEQWLNGVPGPEAIVVAAGDTEAALALIGQLPPDQAEVVLLRTVVGMDVAEVAAIVGKSPGAVRVLAHRGLRTLAGRLADASGALTSRTEV